MNKSWVFKLIPILSIGLFIYVFFTKTEYINTSQWNLATCSLKNVEPLISGDCLFPRKKAFLYKLPYLQYAKSISCRAPEQNEAPTSLIACANEATNSFWGAPQKIPDIGWDAYSVWYTRAATLFRFSEHNTLVQKLLDKDFLNSFPSPEHLHYPWFLPILWNEVMRIAGDANPWRLQVLQLFIFVFVGFLFKAVWPLAPTWLFLCFAFVPIAGRFLFSLYADLWIVFEMLLLLVALKRAKYLLAAAVVFISIHTKQEGWLISLATLCTYCIIEKKYLAIKNTQRTLVAAALAWIFSLSLYLWWSHGLDASKFLTPLSERILDPKTYSYRLPSILRYYLDVLFRPTLWGILWPLSFAIFWRSKKSIPKAAFIPLLTVIAAIPAAYLQFPDGSYKEVVLTGSNRALWETLPILWFLLSKSL